MVKRHEIQVLRRAGVEQAEVAKLAGVSVRSVRRVEAEPDVVSFDSDVERRRRRVGRPSKAEPFHSPGIGCPGIGCLPSDERTRDAASMPKRWSTIGDGPDAAQPTAGVQRVLPTDVYELAAGAAAARAAAPAGRKRLVR